MLVPFGASWRAAMSTTLRGRRLRVGRVAPTAGGCDTSRAANRFDRGFATANSWTFSNSSPGATLAADCSGPYEMRPVLCFSLGYQHSIERVAVQRGKPGCCDAVFSGDIQTAEAAVAYTLGEIVRL